jgi:hypothetical protein
MTASPPEMRVVGVVPWLPWPLSAWRWWTEPVRAERLAALRIGLAACLLLDILFTYLPGGDSYFGQDSLGNAALFDWRTNAPRLSWSILRGVGNPLVVFLSTTVWLTATLWIFADLGTRALHGGGPRERDPLRFSLPIWALAGTLFVLGFWSRLDSAKGELEYAFLIPLPLLGLSLAFCGLDMLRRLRSDDGGDAWVRTTLLIACLGSAVLLGAGLWLTSPVRLQPEAVWSRILGPWNKDPPLVNAAMLAWVGATVLLLLGLWTRPAAITSWVLSISFANINDKIDNAGDTIRIIIQFYLMLCPCGAVWSLDRLLRRWRGQDAPILCVSPWPIRLLFVQLVFIYFCNGCYKLFGGSWRDGDSLFFVLADLTLIRFSPSDNPLPLWALRIMTWTVLVWEVSFLVLVLNRWTRFVALLFGVGFHLGIFASMELGFFVPYTLCIYLTMVPWERWIGPTGFHRNPDMSNPATNV